MMELVALTVLYGIGIVLFAVVIANVIVRIVTDIFFGDKRKKL